MIEKIKRHPRITIMVLITLVVIFFVLIFLNKKGVPQPTPTPQRAKFQLERSFPGQGSQETAFPSTAISFRFNQPVAKESLRLTITPYIKYQVNFDQTEQYVYIKPDPSWRFGTEYQINLSINSKFGDPLTEPIKYNFQFVAPTQSGMTEQPNP